MDKFYKNKKVLITGHTGFKGSWVCMVLKHFDAEVTGYALDTPTNPSLFDICDVSTGMNSIRGDVRDLQALRNVFEKYAPEIVIHMAAQPIVRESYKNPVYTYDVNVMGTVNVLECVRNCDSVRSFINVTTDKVYKNDERGIAFAEGDFLDGYDPYSNSKSCSELVTSSYRNSFFLSAIHDSASADANNKRLCAISTCRAGNVIGGGDFAADRIIPDCVRAALTGNDIIVRNPDSVRPYQHVLEPVMAYLYIAMRQYNDISLSGAYNIGPDDNDCYSTGELVELFINKWNEFSGSNISWINKSDRSCHEAHFLKLDCSLVKQVFGIKPVWNVEYAMEKIAEWTKEYYNHGNVKSCIESQISEYLTQYGNII